jgi:hypothetical protein
LNIKELNIFFYRFLASASHQLALQLRSKWKLKCWKLNNQLEKRLLQRSAHGEASDDETDFTSFK